MENFVRIEFIDPMEFGLLLPCRSGKFWEHQIGGFRCGEMELEGIYLPISDVVPDSVRGALVGLLKGLANANARGDDTGKIWRAIKGALPFEYREVDPRLSSLPNCEGVQWISILRMKDDFEEMFAFRYLVGKTIVLVYPNCD